MNNEFYRSDIDGLRAVAVLSVVIFHIFPFAIPGGFIGVDIFFVISGFLITGNIIKSIESNTFSYRDFYRKRMGRILPALTAVIFGTLLAGYFLLLSDDFYELISSAVASQISLANFYFAFFLDSDYFADDSALQPLLHIWSLGVEEQFYFIWPCILVMLFARISYRTSLLGISCLVVISTFIGEYYLIESPMFSYYMLPSRMGELLAGALVFYFLRATAWRGDSWFGQFIGGAGLLLIALSLFLIDESDGFPGILSLPPVIGAMLVIIAGLNNTTLSFKLLSLRPLVAIGLISYSLYLWHWPILAFYRYLRGSVVSPIAGFALFLIMLGFSLLSYFFIERRYRHRYKSFSKAFLWLFLCPSIVLFAIFLTFNSHLVVSLENSAGDHERKTSVQAGHIRPAHSYSYICQKPRLDAGDLDEDACIVNGVSEPNVLLWGDSHAAHYAGVIAGISQEANFSFRNIAHSSCAPLLLDIEISSKMSVVKDCLYSVPQVHKKLEIYSTVILGGSWMGYFGTNHDFENSLRRSVVGLLEKGKKIIVLGQVPRMPGLDRKCQLKTAKTQLVDCHSQSLPVDDVVHETNEILKELAGDLDNVYYFDVHKYLCKKGQCSAYLDGKLLYFDEGHLNMDGSWLIGKNVIRDQGVPLAFQHLKDVSGAYDLHQGQLREWLDKRTEKKFDPLEVSGEEILGVYPLTSWEGNAEVNQVNSIDSTDRFVVSDTSAKAFHSVSHVFPIPEAFLMEQKASSFLVSLDIFATADVIPLLRVSTLGSNKSSYDLVFNVDENYAKAKRAAKADNIFTRDLGDNRYKLYAVVDLADGTTGVEVKIYPAASDLFPGYAKESVGRITVNSIRILKTH